MNAIQLKETVEENTSTTERVFQDRQYQVIFIFLKALLSSNPKKKRICLDIIFYLLWIIDPTLGEVHFTKYSSNKKMDEWRDENVKMDEWLYSTR